MQFGCVDGLWWTGSFAAHAIGNWNTPLNRPRFNDVRPQTLVSDLGLPPAFEPLVVQEIWRQVSTYEDVVDGIADVGFVSGSVR